MTPVEEYKNLIAENLIKNLEKRNMEAYYSPTKEEALKTVLSLMEENSTVSWGGSVTLADLNMAEALEKGNYTVFDRSKAGSPEEVKEIYHKALSCDYFLMSSNAITKDGILINIDGNGNRVAALIYGPENVIVIVGFNKIVPDVECGYKRVKTEACVPNGIRLNRNTPCHHTGNCNNCLSPDCMCNHIVVTRRSGIKGRIKVVIVGESLGY